MRATLPTMAMQARDSRNKEEGGDSDSVESGVVKSFAAGAINSARRDESGDSDGNLHGTIGNSSDKSDREGSGGYCIVRVDCLNRICDMIYCGQEGVEPKFLSKIVGLQLAYLQVKREARVMTRGVPASCWNVCTISLRRHFPCA